MDVFIKNPDVQSYVLTYLTQQIYKSDKELILRLALWALGHFSLQLAVTDIEQFLETVATTEFSDENTAVLCNSLLKIGMAQNQFQELTLRLLQNLSLHRDPEVQQRACEYSILMTTHSHLLVKNSTPN